MTKQEIRLKTLLKKMFQFDDSELDFGIYRIMNMKRAEITSFIDERLIQAVDEALGEYSSESRDSFERKLEEKKNEIISTLGPDAILQDGSLLPKYSDSKIGEEYIKIKKELLSLGAKEEEKARIFNHIIQFFSRYYDNGDFISRRRYSRENKYCIPYNGEETLLHWATKDQYYIKTGEDFYNYIFSAGEWKVHFKIRNAETETNNNKSSEKRYFVLAKEDTFKTDEDNKVFTVYFEYRAITDAEKEELGAKQDNKIRDKLREKAIEKILNNTEEPLKTELSRKKKSDGPTLLERNMKKYTTKNTTDYFIHKDLEGFLKKELDFYIKNEFFNLDDIENKNMDDVEIARLMASIRAFKNISKKIIEFLTQIENLQKMLWEKKKFVVRSDYCITLDRVPEEFYGEILENEEQIEEWKRLYNPEDFLKEKEPIYYAAGGLKIDEDFLKSHPYMMLDTKFFDEDFKYRLLATFDNLDEATDGLIIKSENWQALNLLQEKYRERIKTIYIDPPYNAKSSEILYKNSFKHSSWLSLMENRIALGQKMMKQDGVFIVAIDENEQERLGLLIENIFPFSKKVAVTIVHNPRGQQGKNVSYVNDFAYFIYRSDEKKYIADVKREEIDSRNLRDSGTESDRSDAKTCFYPFIVKDLKIIEIGDIPSDDFHPSSANVHRDDGTIEIWPIDESGNEKNGDIRSILSIPYWTN